MILQQPPDISGKFYKINGEFYPRVTSIIEMLDKYALKQWAADEAVKHIVSLTADDKYLLSEVDFQAARCAHKVVSSQARSVGTAVHAAIEWFLNTGEKKIEELETKAMEVQAALAFNNFLEWFKVTDIEVLKTETTVYKRAFNYRYAGTFDLLCKIKGVPYIIDFKSSKNFYQEFKLQLAAYRHAFVDPTLKSPNIATLLLSKDSKEHKFRDLTKFQDEKIEQFCHLARYYYSTRKEFKHGD